MIFQSEAHCGLAESDSRQWMIVAPKIFRVSINLLDLGIWGVSQTDLLALQKYPPKAPF